MRISDWSSDVCSSDLRCAHRGSLLCWKNRGQAKDITCPYHHWTYNLSGDLMGLPFLRGVQGKGGMPRDFDKSKNGLTKLRVAVRGGTIWATYSDEVPPLEDYLGPEILMRLDQNGRASCRERVCQYV